MHTDSDFEGFKSKGMSTCYSETLTFDRKKRRAVPALRHYTQWNGEPGPFHDEP